MWRKTAFDLRPDLVRSYCPPVDCRSQNWTPNTFFAAHSLPISIPIVVLCDETYTKYLFQETSDGIGNFRYQVL